MANVSTDVGLVEGHKVKHYNARPPTDISHYFCRLSNMSVDLKKQRKTITNEEQTSPLTTPQYNMLFLIN